MEYREKARKSAEDIATIAKSIEHTLTLEFPKDKIKAMLNVPIKQLDDELQTLKSYIKALK